jgi:hypothetical protein
LPHLPTLDINVDVHVLGFTAGTGDATAPPVPTGVHVRVDLAVDTEPVAPAPEAQAPGHCGSAPGVAASAPGTHRPTTNGQGATPNGAAASGGSEEGAVAMT